MAKPNPRRYLRATVLSGGLGFLLLAGFLAFMDPYGIWRHRGLPHAGHPPLTWSRIAAAERLDARCQVALVGSSRVVFGFGTRLPRIGKRRACNGALGGTSITEIRTVVDFIVQETDVEAMILFVDLHMFHDKRVYNHDWEQSRFNPNRSMLTYYLWSLTSLDAIEDASMYQGWKLPGMAEANPMRSSSQETRGLIKTTLLRPNMYRRFGVMDRSKADFIHILDQIEAHDLKVMVVIPAVHAIQLEVLHTAGLWDANKDWRRYLTQELYDRDIQLWDFATYHSPAISRLPTNVTDKPNPWWADMSHQSQMLGKLTTERIQDAMMGKGGDWEADFGVQLTPSNIEAHLATLDAGREAWRAGQPDQLAWYTQILENVDAIDPTLWDDLANNAARARGEVIDEAAMPVLDLGEDDEEM